MGLKHKSPSIAASIPTAQAIAQMVKEIEDAVATQQSFSLNTNVWEPAAIHMSELSISMLLRSVLRRIKNPRS